VTRAEADDQDVVRRLCEAILTEHLAGRTVRQIAARLECTVLFVGLTVVEQRLAYAGKTLLALPGGHGVARLGSALPGPIHQMIEAYGWTGTTVRAPVPAAAAITAMDQALSWVSLIEAAPPRRQHAELHSPHGGVLLRQIVSARALVHPVTGRNLYNWNRIAQVIGSDHRAIQRWHARGIAEIWAVLNAPNGPGVAPIGHL
jgi:hypothetical protein